MKEPVQSEEKIEDNQHHKVVKLNINPHINGILGK